MTVAFWISTFAPLFWITTGKPEEFANEPLSMMFMPVEKLIAEKLPAIVLISDRGFNHFVVIKGAEDGRILMGDPSTGTRIVSQERFQEIWRNKLLFVIHGYKGQVAFNNPDDWRAAPRARLGEGIGQDQLSATLPKFGPGDF